MLDSALFQTEEIPDPMPPPSLAALSLEETLQHTALDFATALLLCGGADNRGVPEILPYGYLRRKRYGFGTMGEFICFQTPFYCTREGGNLKQFC